ncbi:hypothetical protein Sste5346_009253 [Sporothrix stenoceras]|uniref:Zn(2)-C6 fungal-type domain-containing protein n=1 Tax=Sporothrix stenoceras TaxID=5173 RepID=A0ABR3YL70_9PEZI
MDTSQPTTQKHACASCARRKIRCDRRQPCSNCVAHARMTARRSRHRDDTSSQELDVDCVYVEPPPVQRHRRKMARAVPSSTVADELIDRLRMYEDLLQKNGISAPDSLSQKELTFLQKPLPRPRSRESNEDDDNDSDDRVWIASPWEVKMAMHKGLTTASISTAQTPSSGAETLIVSETGTEGAEAWPVVAHEDAADEELDLWQSLPPELRNPPVSSVFARRFFGQKTGEERATDDRGLPPLNVTTASTLFGTTHPEPVAHPEPRMILHLWQTFIDNVNPVMRIVHVPTTHQQIVDASWDAANAPPATGALMFAIYALALTSMTATEYADMFANTKTRQTPQTEPPPKSELLTRYRMGAMQCLVDAGVLTTRRLDVLRAFTLLILAEPDSELSSTLASMAVHLGLKLGLHRESHSNAASGGTGNLSFFDSEMSVRLWWQIRGIDARMRQAVSLSYTNSLSTMGGNQPSSIANGGNYFGSGTLPPSDLEDLRLPLNVNDTDLHPDMTCAPVEHAGPTEMLYVRVKYHTALWMRAFAQKKFASGSSGGLGDISTPSGHLYRTQTLPAMKNRAIDELEQLYTDICHRFADPRIPLHAVSSSMARMAVAQLRFQAYHPRTSAAQPPSLPPTANGGYVYSAPAFSRHNADATFRHALSILEMCFVCRQVASVGNGFAAFQLLADVVMRVVMDATVYVLCMLRIRTGGVDSPEEEQSNIDLAWRMVELFYKEYDQDMAAATNDYEQHFLHLHQDHDRPQSPGNNDEAAEETRKLAAGASFVTAFTDLTLEAWNAREKACLGMGTGTVTTPGFIAELQAKKASLDQSSAAVSGWGEMLFQQDDSAMDWEYWNNFLRM